MKVVLAFVIVLQVARPTSAQQSPKPPTPEEMQKMMAMMGPGPEHKAFDVLVGTWHMDVTYRMGGGQEMKFNGRTTNKLIIGGRFLMSESVSKDPTSGVTVEALSIYGFDRRTSEHTIVGYDSMGTYYVTAAGKKVPNAKQVVMQGEVAEPGGVKKYDMVLRWVDNDSYVTEIVFHLPTGDLKIADVTHRRIK